MRTLLCALCMTVLSTAIIARNDRKDLHYLKTIPSPERLIKDLDGPNDLERTAKRLAVLSFARTMVHTMARSTTEQVQREENELLEAFSRRSGLEYEAYMERHPNDGKALQERQAALRGSPELRAMVERSFEALAPGVWDSFIAEEALREQRYSEAASTHEELLRKEAAQREARASGSNTDALLSHGAVLLFSGPLTLIFALLLLRWARREKGAFILHDQVPRTVLSRNVTYTPFTYSGIVHSPSTMAHDGLDISRHGDRVTVHTTHEQVDRFFLIMPDGQQKSMVFTNTDVHVAPGHRFSGLELKGSDGSRKPLYYFNHHTSKETLFRSTINELTSVRTRGLFYMLALVPLLLLTIPAVLSLIWGATMGGLSDGNAVSMNWLLLAMLMLATFVLFSTRAKSVQEARKRRFMEAIVAPVQADFRSTVIAR